MAKKQKGAKNTLGETSRDCTINLHKRIHKVQFKRKAPTAVKEIVKFVQRTMLTRDVRIDRRLNEFLWSNGIRNVPRRVRVRISRRKNDDDQAKEQFYTLVEHVDVDSYKGLLTEVSKVKKD